MVVLAQQLCYGCRYIVIVHPLKARSWCTMGNTKKLIAGVWVVAITLSSPTLYIMVSSSKYSSTPGLYAG